MPNEANLDGFWQGMCRPHESSPGCPCQEQAAEFLCGLAFLGNGQPCQYGHRQGSLGSCPVPLVGNH